MEPSLLVGFACLLLGAACGGSFGLPSKYAGKDTPWEVLWGPFFFFVTLAMPLAVGPLVVHGFFDVFRSVGLAALAAPLALGFLWGLGSMTLGMSFAFIGLSLAYSLNYGAQIIFGALAPMALHHPERILTDQGLAVLAGVGVCVVGVVLSGRAGMLKECDQKAHPNPERGERPGMLPGLALAVASGLLCACYGVAASYTGPVDEAARALSNEPWRASLATTAAILFGGAISSCLYCLAKLTKNGTWGRLAGPGAGRVLAVALAMALLHNGAIYFFNLGFPMLGDLGVSVGYAAFMSLAILVGNAHGFRTGEWAGASPRSLRWIVAGVVALIVGVCVLAAANTMAPPG